jgi:hypothetical protein
MTNHTFLFFSYVAFLLFFGFACLLVPGRIQRLAERSVQMGPSARSERLFSLVSSHGFLWNVRATGIIALLMALLLIITAKR